MLISFNPLGFIVDGIQSFLMWALLSLDALVYSLINWVYQIILVLSDANVLENTTVMDELVDRIYIILGVIMLSLTDDDIL